MNVETLQDLILLHINNKTTYLSNVHVVKHSNSLFKYTSLHFKYNGIDVEIKIYNSSFIQIKIDNNLGKVCDSLSNVRFEIDKLFAYR